MAFKDQTHTETVDQRGSLLFVPLNKAVHRHNALLVGDFDGHALQVRARGCLANRSRIVGVVPDFLPATR
jgi:hypothetical protein